ncbi:MAG: endonuclease Q family protein [Candidatus Bathycorpusculaceae bacterium]
MSYRHYPVYRSISGNELKHNPKPKRTSYTILRISKLDKYTLLSFSDSHTYIPLRIGREFTTFNLDKLCYKEIYEAIKKKDKSKIVITGEFFPEEGKYHFTGHRNCGISLHPKDAIKLNNICPKCGRKLTVGVLQRVEELADRPEGFIPKDSIPFKHLIPLMEIIAEMFKTNAYSQTVWKEYYKLVEKFGNELNILLNIPKEELLKVTDEKIADAIIKVREGKVRYIAGYDGVYGKPVFDEKFEPKKEKFMFQKNLREF